jgi:hypothetical protein
MRGSGARDHPGPMSIEQRVTGFAQFVSARKRED